MKTQITISEEKMSDINRQVDNMLSKSYEKRTREELVAIFIDIEERKAKKAGKSSKKFAARRAAAEAAKAPISMAEYAQMFSASKWNQNTVWMLAEKNLPIATNDFLDSLVKQFLSGKQLSDKQAYYLAKAKVEQA